MVAKPIYVPILKGKEGEYAALESLKPDVRRSLAPLIEVPAIPYDYANDRPAKSLEEHVAGVAERLKRSCPDVSPYLDMPWFGEQDQFENGRIALDSVLADCIKQNVKAIPVVSRASSAAYLNAARRYSIASGVGACIRLLVEDFEEEIDLDQELERILRGLDGVAVGSIDLILDLEDLGTETGRALLIARSVFSMIPNKGGNWRRIILAAASFPENLSDVDSATIARLPRLEWELWKSLQRRPERLPAGLVYGDYAISHPAPTEIDPRTMRMSANIRYTTADKWLIVKGRNVRQYGFEQYFELCRTLREQPEYSGSKFSWGDNYISDCADRMTGPGNATTWRKVGTNHHLTLLVTELSNLRPGS